MNPVELRSAWAISTFVSIAGQAYMSADVLVPLTAHLSVRLVSSVPRWP